MQTWFLQSVQQLLNRAVDRGAALCPGEQSWLWGQAASRATGVEETQRGGRASREVAGQQEALLPAKMWMRGPCKDVDEGRRTYLCVSDAFGNAMNLWAFS